MLYNNAVKNLLAANGKAFKLLHDMCGMDFENEFFIGEYTGKFTYNSLVKAFENLVGKSEWIKDYRVYLYYIPDDFYYKNLCIAEIRGEICARREDIYGIENYTFFSTRIDTLVMKKDMEKIRKNEKTRYWIVAQKREKFQHREPIYDEAERYVVKDMRTYLRQAGGKTEYIGTLEVYPRHTNYRTISIAPNGRSRCLSIHVPATEICSIIDKSGYRTGIAREKYRIRLANIKRKRSEKQAAAYDNTEKCAEFEKRIHAINGKMIEYLGGDITTIPYGKISKVYKAIAWGKCELNALYRNEFSTMEEVNRTVAYIETQLREAENALKED